jgi:outer membrane immunogenic protein
MLRCAGVLVAVACWIVSSLPAFAQPPQRWNGPYAGVNIGRGSADFGSSASIGGGPVWGGGLDADSAFIGIQAGFNKRIGNFFVGLEADLQTADLSNSIKATSGSFAFNASASLDWFATARVRAGLATHTMLAYVTGGLAFGGVDYDATIKSGSTIVHLNDGTRTGYVLGAGLEFALRSNWSLKVEYQYLNFGDAGASGAITSIFNNICAPPSITTTAVAAGFDADVHTVRIGLNYQFHAPARHDPLKP